jgi:hypothetical protein
VVLSTKRGYVLDRLLNKVWTCLLHFWQFTAFKRIDDLEEIFIRSRGYFCSFPIFNKCFHWWGNVVGLQALVTWAQEECSCLKLFSLLNRHHLRLWKSIWEWPPAVKRHKKGRLQTVFETAPSYEKFSSCWTFQRTGGRLTIGFSVQCFFERLLSSFSELEIGEWWEKVC